jgi:DNA-binding LytR/AlgR family response regulator
MNVLIIEDEALAVRQLKTLLHDIDSSIHVVGSLDSIESSVLWLRNHPEPELMFVDIQLSDGLSFEIFKQCSVTAPVIFVTAYDEYALQAFKVNSIDYLLKPIEKRELEVSIEKYRKFNPQYSPLFQRKELAALLSEFRPNYISYKTRFLVKTGQTFITILTADIAYLVCDQKLSYIVTKEGKKHLIDGTLEELEDQMDPRQFFRLNRQFLASVESIFRVHNYFNRKLKIELKPSIDIEVLVSREKATALKQWLNQ